MSWIPVIERVPDNDRPVLIWVIGSDHEFGFYSPWDGGTNGVKKGKWYMTDYHGFDYVVPVSHWMPLPDAPK